MSGFRAAITFLTRLPVGTAQGMDGAVGWFPLVGALVGLAVGGAYALLYPWVPSLLGAVVAVSFGAFLTGAIHEDGLGDSFDALGSGATGDEAMRIMRDSPLGTYGTIAVVVSLLWRVMALGSLSPAEAVAGMVMAHGLARAAAVCLMAITRPARPDGLGHAGVSSATEPGVWFAVATGLAISFLATGWWAVPAVALAVLVVVVLRRAALARVGGVTGDLLGACEQVAELLALAVVAVAAWQGWAPWWSA